MDQGIGGCVLMKKTRGEISHASVPLRPTGQCFHKKELFKLWRLPTPLVCGQTQHGKQYFILQHNVHCVQSLYVNRYVYSNKSVLLLFRYLLVQSGDPDSDCTSCMYCSLFSFFFHTFGLHAAPVALSLFRPCPFFISFILVNICSFLLSSHGGFPVPRFFLGTFPCSCLGCPIFHFFIQHVSL
jgi:hypothetical protein